MTRTPRANDLRTITGNLRKRLPADISRKTLVYAGAGLALAGAGAAAVTTGFSGTTANASADTVSHAAVVAASQHAKANHGKTSHGKASDAKASHGKADQATKHVTVKHAAKQSAKPTAKHAAKSAQTWAAVSKIVAERTYPKPGHGALPAQDQLSPAGTTGSQSWMPITADRYANAKTIVKQAIAKHMGLRSAVIAVATAMQESTLQNIKYGTSDSLGLFQQRPSMGWGSAQQVTTPSYAADAFLNALHKYQASNPAWARQPLWQSAQGVQASGFPTAYAKWEAQAAQLVQSVTKHLV